MNATFVRPPFTETIPWRVVIERTGTHRLHTMRLRADMPIKAVMEEILALYQREQPWWFRWLSQHVDIATISTDIHIDIEDHARNGQDVRITRRSPSSLTWATHHMSAVSFDPSVEANSFPLAILLRPKHTYIGLCILAAVVLLAIVVPGALLGVLIGQAELGIALAAAITGLFALVGKFRGWMT